MAKQQRDLPPFTGFADTRRTFFKRLAQHQDRTWFEAHKAEYQSGWQQPMQELMHEVQLRLQGSYKTAHLGTPSVFRIYRDVRFGPDKTPYKTHVAGVVPVHAPAQGKTEAPVALYFHLGPSEVTAAAGLYVMSGPTLKRYREAVMDSRRGPQLQRIIKRLEGEGYTVRSYARLKTAPRGVDKDHPRIDLLCNKSLTVSFPKVPVSLLTQAKLAPWLAQHAKKASKLVEWLAALL